MDEGERQALMCQPNHLSLSTPFPALLYEAGFGQIPLPSPTHYSSPGIPKQIYSFKFVLEYFDVGWKFIERTPMTFIQNPEQSASRSRSTRFIIMNDDLDKRSPFSSKRTCPISKELEEEAYRAIESRAWIFLVLIWTEPHPFVLGRGHALIFFKKNTFRPSLLVVKRERSIM